MSAIPPPWWQKNTVYKIEHKRLKFWPIFMNELNRNSKKKSTYIIDVQQLSPTKFEILMVDPYPEFRLTSWSRYKTVPVYKKLIVDRELGLTEVQRYEYQPTLSKCPFIQEYDLYQKHPMKKGVLVQYRHMYLMNMVQRWIGKFETLLCWWYNPKIYGKEVEQANTWKPIATLSPVDTAQAN